MSEQKALVARLRELRAARNLNQDRLAAALHVSKSLIASFETGRLIPQIKTARTLDEFYGTGDEIQRKAKEAREGLQPWLRPWAVHESQAVLLRSWNPC